MITTPTINQEQSYASKERHQRSSYGPSSALMEESYEGNFNESTSDSAFQRPRRPNPDTLSYCKVLPLSLQIAQTELKEFEHQMSLLKNEDEQEVLDVEEMIQNFIPSRTAAQSAIEEVQNEIASLAGDEEGSAMMETLAKIVCISYNASSSSNTEQDFSLPPDTKSVVKLMNGLKGYCLHLSTHRYGSHVLQTILQCAGKCMKANDGQTSGKEKQLLCKLIKNVLDELIPHTRELSVHICGSHVLRTLLYLLVGVQIEDMKGGSQASSHRGKPKKKKKKKKKFPNAGMDPNQLSAKNVSNPMLKYHLYKDKEVALLFHSCLTDFTNAFIYENRKETASDGAIDANLGYELQTLVCHPSAGPLLSVLLRVLCIMDRNPKDNPPGSSTDDNGSLDRDYRLLGISPPEPQYQSESTADKLVKAILCWEDDENNKGSSIPSAKSGDIIYGLSGEPTGSIFLETVLRSCGSDEFYADFCKKAGFFSAEPLHDYTTHSVSNFVIQTLLVTCRTKEQAEILYKGLMPCVTTCQKLEKQQNVQNEEGNGTNNDLSLPLLLQKKRRGVLFRLVELCAKWKVGQEKLLKGIYSGFAIMETKTLKGEIEDSTEKEEDAEKSKARKRKKKTQSLSVDQCVRKLLDLDVSDLATGGRISLDTNGARAIYHMLHFVPRLCGDILETLVNQFSTDEIEKLAMDGVGSRCILDAILSNPSSSIPPFSTSINDLLVKLEGRWTSLSVDRVGHHSVKKMFHALSTVDLKLNLIQELGQAEMNRLSGNAMGRAVIEECSLHDFMRGGEYTWKDVVSKKMRQKEWLSELCEEGNAVEKPTKKRRKRRKGANSGADLEDGKKDNNISKTSVVNTIMDTLTMNSSLKEKTSVGDSKSVDDKSRRSRKRKRKKASGRE